MKSLVLAKNSTALHYFIQPPLNPQLKVHIFNYTNTERFLDGTDDKLIVKDIGPFVYTEKTTKVEVVYNNNNTISYRVNILLFICFCFFFDDCLTFQSDQNQISIINKRFYKNHNFNYDSSLKFNQIQMFSIFCSGTSIIWFSSRLISWPSIRSIHCAKCSIFDGCMGAIESWFHESLGI